MSQDASLYLQQAGPPGYLKAPLWAEQPYYRAPFASIYFGALFDLCRFDRVVAAALQALLVTTGYVAIFSLARRNLGTRIALAGTALAAIHPVLIFFDCAI